MATKKFEDERNDLEIESMKVDVEQRRLYLEISKVDLEIRQEELKRLRQHEVQVQG